VALDDLYPLEPADSAERQSSAIARAAMGQRVVEQDIVSSAYYPDFSVQLSQAGIHSLAVFPLSISSGQSGVLAIFSNESHIFGEEELRLLDELSADLAFGLNTMRLRKEREQAILDKEQSALILQRSMGQTIEAIAMTLEKRDPYTAGHQQRVLLIATAIAKELGWDSDRIQGLELGAMIHDIGKVYVPSDILNRPGKLTPEEMAIIRTHSSVGYEIIKDIEFPWPVADMVHQHHERLDGSGYPQGLTADEIIPEAKIMSVADVVEAITSHRPYRPSLGIDFALEEINKYRGVLYDAAAVDACNVLIKEKNFSLQGWEKN